jgi:hypothetical protein
MFDLGIWRMEVFRKTPSKITGWNFDWTKRFASDEESGLSLSSDSDCS